MLESDQGDQIVNILEREIGSHTEVCNGMRTFLNLAFGNDGWERLVHARWLKRT